jgi:fructose-bisphosphate aldolase class I
MLFDEDFVQLVKTSDMQSTVAALLTHGKGILAMDESFRTIEKRLKAASIPATDENRRAYRELLATTPGLNDFISGVILFDETIREWTMRGMTIPEILHQQGIIPGIKVDKGAVPMANFPGERLTQGLDDLRERLAEYYALGARFTKWRAVFTVGEGTPTNACIESNARMLAIFASLSQEAGLVPIVEPEVLMDGNHTIERCEQIIYVTLRTVFDALFEHRVVLENMLLKTGMVLAGTDCPDQADLDLVSERTLRCLARAVPVAVPGIVFLSGGQEAGIATQRLNAICRASNGPWTLTFSFGRALQEPALNVWKGNRVNIDAAQEALHERARDNSLAVQGTYAPTALPGEIFINNQNRTETV